ncbi:hypothetical protein UFOVP353_22 [uncultured Caudovirales phage]|uniref:Uncharacterized protein n=1 Tax=uncultured Caudovirales phage TaxID=2100421 RepID=A0A6J5M0J0_9CAUD|nr:hypothetical protein UFOVP353_22 [uncultured Caudovirales phage]
MKKAILACLLLAGCVAVIPENIHEVNNVKVCRAWADGMGEKFLQDEINKRNIECGAILAYDGQKRAVAASIANANRPRHCTAVGNTLSCY